MTTFLLTMLCIYIVSTLIFFTKFAKDEPTVYTNLYTDLSWTYKILSLLATPILILIYYLLLLFI